MSFRILRPLAREMASPISLGRFQRFRVSAFDLSTYFRFLLSKFLLLSVRRPVVYRPRSFCRLHTAHRPLTTDFRFQRFRISVFQLLILLSLSIAVTASAQTNVTPDQYLASQPKPVFAPGHHLPHLTRCGWPLSSNLNVEAALHWGYTLDLQTGDTNLLAALRFPNTTASGYVSLATNNPGQYALSVNLNKTFPSPIPNGFYVTNASGWFVDIHSNTWQYITNTSYTPVVSPEAPDDYLSNSAAYDVATLRTIQSNVPISIVLNTGEYGLRVSAFNSNAWQFDPRVQAALATNGLSMYRYTSNQKAHQLGFTTVAINQALPNRELYIFYNTAGEQSRLGPGWDTAGWRTSYGYNSDVIATNTDLPSFQDYYPVDGYWTNSMNTSLNTNMLTRHLDGVGYNMALGHTTNYSWVCGGWDQGNGPSDFSDIPHYMGFLKCLYTGGMVGAVAGYFTYPTNGFNASFPTNNPPQWLLQIMALSHVHALFSHFDNFLSSGDLLSGPQHHAMSADQPAYEFTNTMADATARVLARKLHNTNQWLITAWAAGGPDRTVTVTIPTLGSVSVLARSCGSVYQATTTNLTLIDTNGLLPSGSFAETIAPPTNLHIIPGISN